MKKGLVLTLVMAVMTLSLYAQQNGQRRGQSMDPKELATRMTENLKENLKLTKTQVDEVSKINATALEEIMALRDNTSTKAQTKMQVLRKKMAYDIYLVLNEEQRAKYIEMEVEREGRAQRMEGQHQRGQGGQRGERPQR